MNQTQNQQAIKSSKMNFKIIKKAIKKPFNKFKIIKSHKSIHKENFNDSKWFIEELMEQARNLEYCGGFGSDEFNRWTEEMVICKFLEYFNVNYEDLLDYESYDEKASFYSTSHSFDDFEDEFKEADKEIQRRLKIIREEQNSSQNEEGIITFESDEDEINYLEKETEMLMELNLRKTLNSAPAKKLAYELANFEW